MAAVASLLVAHVFRLPEAYWAAIATLVTLPSTLGASLPISAQRFAGTAVGAAVGAFVGTYVPGNVLFFGIAVFVIGLFCAALRVERSAYRYASITLAIVMLVPRSNSEWGRSGPPVLRGFNRTCCRPGGDCTLARAHE